MATFEQEVGRIEGKLDMILSAISDMKESNGKTADTVTSHGTRISSLETAKTQAMYLGGLLVSGLLAAFGWVGPHLQDMILRR